MARLALALMLLTLPLAASAADCRQFFYQRQQVVVAAPVYAVPQIIYQAGIGIEHDALAEKIALKVEKRLELRAQQRQQVAARPQSVVAQHCAKCHSGPTPKAGMTFDGVTPIESRFVTAALVQIRDEAMPKDHKLPPGAAPGLMNELLSLISDRPPPAVPREVGPLPAPAPDDGGLR